MKAYQVFGGIGIVAICGIIVGGVIYATRSTNDPEVLKHTGHLKTAHEILIRMPVIDGNLRNFVFNDLKKVNFAADLKKVEPWASAASSHTDLPRLRAGRVGAQFWVAYVSCDAQYKDAVTQTYEQVDVIKRLVKAYPNDLQYATSAHEIEDAIKKKKIASLIGVEGGHSIQSSFGVLRTLYELGTRYMTLTHACNTPWADSSPVDIPNPPIPPQNGGLSEFGIEVVHEMNRLGMMVDLSHVSADAMRAGLKHSKAPVIFSHSSAYELCKHHRNVPDDVIKMVKDTNSLIMVNFYSAFIQCNPNVVATLDDVVEHIDYIRNITGPDHVGIGADYDGVSRTPDGLEDTSKYPFLFEALLKTGRWSESDLEKLSGRNLLRVFRDVEKTRDKLRSGEIHQDTISRKELETKGFNLSCITSKFPDDIKTLNNRRKRDTISDDFTEL